MHPCPNTLSDRLVGTLLGTAVGDAVGLPREGLSAARASRLFGGSPLHHRFIFSRGMCSDDTEHSCMAAQALLASRGDPERFIRSFGWRLRFWILGLPAGIGFATLRAALKLWLGVSPHRSGVCSAGNGAAMRAALIGVYAASDLDKLCELVRLSSRITHTDERAVGGALTIALGAAYGSLNNPADVTPGGFLRFAEPILHGTAIWPLVEGAAWAVETHSGLESYLQRIGCEGRISGFVNHTVPASIYCWLAFPGNFRSAVEKVILAGGDADTTGAITGALAGSTTGLSGIPQEWLDGLVEWPRGVNWMRKLALSLGESALQGDPKTSPLPLFWPALPLRNLVFFVAVVIHALRRALPPY